MPYADRERRLEYNREWARRNAAGAADGPLCKAVEAIIALLDPEPASPSQIQAVLGRSNTNSIGVALNRLQHAGRVRNVGYGQWVLSEANTLADDLNLILAQFVGRNVEPTS